jgi:hypothetical protein
LRFDQGSGATLGYGSVNLALGAGQADGLPLPTSGNLRIQILEWRSTLARLVVNISDVADHTDDTWQQRLYLDTREEVSPDTLRVLTTPSGGTPDYDTGDVGQAQNRNTGGSWTYSRFEIIKDGTCSYEAYNTFGQKQGVTYTVTWPTNGTYGTALKHMHGVAGAGFYWRWAQIWIGSASDSWPAM